MNRQDNINRLRQGDPFDLVVIGGGATGCGIALDAATRGLSVALLERDDFAQGTSSKSTKLVHGGVRYLEKAVKKLDRAQFDLVREGLRERGRLLRNAPHLAHSIWLMTPVKTWREAAYIYAGLVLYDMLSGCLSLGRSAIVSKKKAAKLFPQLNLDGYVAAVIYSDGQFNDARMAVTLARTAASYGAVCANHVEVTGLVKQGGRISGVTVRDRLNGEEFTIAAKGVVNAAGPFADAIRRMDDPEVAPMLKTSSGIHILLPADVSGNKNAVQAVVDINGHGISTSGSYRNYYELNGKRLTHVIDPQTGRPIEHNLVSVTVIAPTALEADGWDTGLMVLGPEKAKEVVRREGLAVYMIMKEGEGFNTWMSPQFKSFLVSEKN